MTRQSGVQGRLCFVDWDELIPEDHLLRQIDRSIDFSFIYDLVKDHYSPHGRPSIDPVLLFKMTLIGYLYGIRSERRLEQEVKLNLAYRWFLGLEVDDPVPDHSVFSQNRRRRFGDSELFQQIFDHLVQQCIERGLVTGRLLVTDSTHLKANAALDKSQRVAVRLTPSEYLQALDAEADRLTAQLRGHDPDDDPPSGGGGRPPRRPAPSRPQRPPRRREETVSTVDPDARLLGQKGKPPGFHYKVHQTIDADSGIITDIHTTPGNVNDHEPLPERLDRIVKRFGLSIQQVAADRGYDAMRVHRKLSEHGIQGFIPRMRKRAPAMTFRTDRFTYDPEEDAYRCPGDRWLRFRHVSRTTYQKVYAARTEDCRQCALRAQCVAPTARVKQITRPFFQDDADRTHRNIGTPAYAAAQRLRRIWGEGTFALQKRLHNLDRARMRGRDRVHEQSLMSGIAVNVKRMVRVLQTA